MTDRTRRTALRQTFLCSALCAALAVDAQLLERVLVSPVFGDTSNFGFSVTLDGDHAFVGAPNFHGHGAVFVFARNNEGLNGWGYAQTLLPNDTILTSNFGYAMDADGGTLAVGSLNEFDGFGSADLSGVYFYRFDEGGDGFVKDTVIMDAASLGGSGAVYGVGLGVSIRRRGSYTAVADRDGGVNFGTPNQYYNTGRVYVDPPELGGAFAEVGGWSTAIYNVAFPPVFALSNDTVIYPFFGDFMQQAILGNSSWRLLGNLGYPVPDYQALDADDGVFAVGVPTDPAMGNGAGAVVLFRVDTLLEITTVHEPVPLPSAAFGSQVAMLNGLLAANGNSALQLYEQNVGGLDNWGHLRTVRPPGFQLNGDVDISENGEVIVGGTFTEDVGIAYLLYDPAVAIAERSSKPTFRVYPIPVHDHLVVQAERPFVGDLQLLDPKGRTITHAAWTGGDRHILDVTRVAPGLYILVGTDHSGAAVLAPQRIVIQ